MTVLADFSSWPAAAGFLVFVRWLWREDSAAGSTTIRRPRRQSAMHDTRETVLFVCTHNSARSQMAEALLRDMARDRFHVASAGTHPTTIHPLTVSVMENRGLSLDGHRAKSLHAMGAAWDYVITLCDEAFEECPDFPVKTCRLHWSIEDPARPKATPDDQLDAFCRVRDDLALRLRRWLADRAER